MKNNIFHEIVLLLLPMLKIIERLKFDKINIGHRQALYGRISYLVDLNLIECMSSF